MTDRQQRFIFFINIWPFSEYPWWSLWLSMRPCYYWCCWHPSSCRHPWFPWYFWCIFCPCYCMAGNSIDAGVPAINDVHTVADVNCCYCCFPRFFWRISCGLCPSWCWHPCYSMWAHIQQALKINIFQALLITEKIPKSNNWKTCFRHLQMSSKVIIHQ